MNLLIAPLALLWPAALVLCVLDGRRPAVAWGAVGALGAASALLGALALATGDGDVVAQVAGGWPADVGIRLRADALGALFAAVSCVVLTAALAQAVAVGLESRAVPALTVLLALGLSGLFLTGDVFSFYVFFELSMISSYALAAVGGGPRQASGAFIFAVVNLLGSFIFLIAVAGLYRVTGTLEMEAVAERMAEVDPSTALLIAVSFFVAFGVKLGLFPFHFWLPAVYASAPPAIGAMLAGALANIGAYGLLRFGAELLPREVELASAALVVIGSLSIVYGALQAVGRRNTRDVLAYSSIGQAGYVLVALGLGGPVGLAAAVVFSIANSLNKALLFVAAELRGPLVAFATAVGALSVAGVPPTAGFFGKAALFEAGVEADDVAVVVLLVVGSLLSFVYMFQLFQHDHWQPGTQEDAEARPATPVMRVGVGLLALVVLGLGLWPEPLLAVGEEAAATLRAGAP